MNFPVIKPMLANPGKEIDLTTLAGTHTFDVKLDGTRCIAYWDGQTLKLVNRSMIDVTAKYPDLVATAASLGPVPLILDGEIVANTGTFQDTAKRDKQTKPTDVAYWAKALPVTFIAFDLLHRAGADFRTLPYEKRRLALDYLHLNSCPSRNWTASIISTDPGFYETVKAMGMEGIIAKRNTSTYRSGRSSDWIKRKTTRRLTAIATGYEPGTGARLRFGAMFIQLIGPDGLVPIGRVGTGMTATEIDYLKAELDAQRPVLVEIECLNVSREGQLRFPVYVGVRSDLTLNDATLAQLATIPRMG